MRPSVRASLNGAWNLGTSGAGNRIGRGSVAFVLLLMARVSPADDARSGNTQGLPEKIAIGQELFLREWKIDDPRSAGDGLGPMYNAASCAECHRLGGIGGAGANDENVDLLTIMVSRSMAVARDKLTQWVAAFHPALARGRLSATTVLHRFSADPNYGDWRRRFFSARQQSQLSPAPIASSKHAVNVTNAIQRLDAMAYQHSQRNTPALFGAGMIDRLSDSVFDEMQARQASSTGGVSGRVPRAANGRVGRFGWRGQTENLHEFVLGACAVELGLEAPGHAQPVDPLDVNFDDSGRPDRPGTHGFDISDDQCQSLTQFVAHLPPPRQAVPADDLAAETAARGELQFAKLGCADCHVPQVAEIAGVYSDLLLHDMGEGLEDPVPANPAQASRSSGSYYGGADSLLARVEPEQRREWRTPPLWGVRDSGPYLHDGRAQTFAEAIAWHGGEAAKSAREFRRLPKNEQEEVIAFLDCLAAPTPESLALENVVFTGGQ